MSYSPGTQAIEARRKRLSRWLRILRKREGEELGYTIATHAVEVGVSASKLEEYTKLLVDAQLIRVIMLDDEGHREVEFLSTHSTKRADYTQRGVAVDVSNQAAYVAGSERDKSQQSNSNTAVV